MAARQCLKCRTIFNYYSGDPICPRCKDELEGSFKIVRKFLRQYPMSTIGQTEEATGVPAKYITKFIRDGRLELSTDSPIGIDCQRCGKNIHIGHYCEECETEIRKEFNTAMNKGSTMAGRTVRKDGELSNRQYLNRRGY